MPTEYVMPKLAMGMNEGTVVEWLVSEGQQVEFTIGQGPKGSRAENITVV